MMKIKEQQDVLENTKKNLLVSASAGSGKTHVLIDYICEIICEKQIPLSKILVLTFTKAAASQMKEKLLEELKKQDKTPFVVEQIDCLPTSNISTIHSFCEKYIKKYANLLKINANFEILDENLNGQIREQAFVKAYSNFEKQEPENFSLLASSFKDDKKKIAQIVFGIENLAGAVADRDEFLRKNLNEAEEYFQKAVDYLFLETKSAISEQISRLEKLHVGEFEFQVKNALQKYLQSENIFEMSRQNVVYPRLKSKKDFSDAVAKALDEINANIKKAIKDVASLNLQDEKNVDFQKKGVLEGAFIKFFQSYEKVEQEIKTNRNGLNFYDLERYMKKLSEQENLFDGLEYVFVDEYQDTNKIQEKIVKNVAKNCNFVAVGDIKQGIYGFRLASSEIFLKDLKEFDEQSDGAVNFLKYNFRSRQEVLDFVNDVFKVCMKKDVTGVDYEQTSMLQSAGLKPMLDEGVKAVNIDLVKESKQEADEIPKIYSVKDAKMTDDNHNETLLRDIKRRILEVLNSKICEDGVLRQARFGDIAILSRKRDAFFTALENYLQDEGIPVVANSRNILMEQPHMQVLLNLLKIALNFDDDIACASVLAGLFHFKTYDLPVQDGQSLCDAVKNDKSGKFEFFKEKMAEFRQNCTIYGIKFALNDLFEKTNYRAFINLNHKNLNVFVETFLQEVEKFNFDLPALISYFETVDIVVTSEVSMAENSVLLSTIHNSKGLEYPVVFLISCDQNLFAKHEEVEINEQFGLALKIFNHEDNTEFCTARMMAVSKSRKKKNFVEEMMIFYVALTRAKNRLYLFGEYSDSIFNRASLSACRTYFDFIFFALESVKQQFLQNGGYEGDNLSINQIDEVNELQFGQKQNLENMEYSADDVKKIEQYLNFSYNLKDVENFKLKESVTSLNNKNQDAVLGKFSNENFNFSENFVEIGVAYHEALRLIDFEKVSDMVTLEQEIVGHNLDCSLIDKQLLLKNILLLRKLTDGQQVFKEREFLMREKLSELVGGQVADEILVQGVVDLYIIGKDEITLVDYKFSNRSAQSLVKKYREQLKLYALALEKSMSMPVKKAFLLSLKEANLIEVTIF